MLIRATVASITTSGCSAANVPVVEMISNTPDADRFLLGAGHHQVSAVGDHPVNGAAEGAAHRYIPGIQGRHRGGSPFRLDVFDALGVYLEVFEHLRSLKWVTLPSGV